MHNNKKSLQQKLSSMKVWGVIADYYFFWLIFVSVFIHLLIDLFS